MSSLLSSHLYHHHHHHHRRRHHHRHRHHRPVHSSVHYYDRRLHMVIVIINACWQTVCLFSCRDRVDELCWTMKARCSCVPRGKCIVWSNCHFTSRSVARQPLSPMCPRYAIFLDADPPRPGNNRLIDLSVGRSLHARPNFISSQPFSWSQLLFCPPGWGKGTKSAERRLANNQIS